ncbi:hypothetical protein [Actinacidiphila sp. bgisy167]|uniref:hypothetical protein n=1 Tax=Actinacidiphila sp. bgisy167 TaxID=3413797 RepID=UPI003D754765
MAPFRSTTRAVAAALCGAAVLLAGCGPAGGGAAEHEPPGDRVVRGLLERRADAVLRHDEKAYLADVTPARRAAERQVFRNLGELPLASFSYRLLSTRGADPVTAHVRLRYRLGGYDSAPATADESLLLRPDGGGHWRVAGDGDPGGQLWEQGALNVVRGSRSIVLGTGDRAELAGYATDADRAVPQVRRAWGEKGWTGRVVLEVPSSLRQMGQLLKVPARTYADVAAVTTGEAGGNGTAPAGRVIVNPEAFAGLSPFGRQVVLTHETTHVATRAATTSRTPMWLSEGFADWVAYRDSGRPATALAPELRRDVTAAGPPRRLPADADFAPGAPAQAQAYEGAWLACRFIADTWGADRLVELYRSGADPRRTLGIGEDALTARWRACVQEELG